MESDPSAQIVPNVYVLVSGGVQAGGDDGQGGMTDVWYQVEFFSDQEQRWVALFGKEKTVADAEGKRRDWLRDAKSRVVKVTQTMEVVSGSK